MNAKNKRVRSRHHEKIARNVPTVGQPNSPRKIVVAKGSSLSDTTEVKPEHSHGWVGFTNIVTILGAAATTGLATATLLPAAPIAVLTASALGSVAAYAVARKLDK